MFNADNTYYIYHPDKNQTSVNGINIQTPTIENKQWTIPTITDLFDDNINYQTAVGYTLTTHYNTLQNQLLENH